MEQSKKQNADNGPYKKGSRALPAKNPLSLPPGEEKKISGGDEGKSRLYPGTAL